MNVQFWCLVKTKNNNRYKSSKYNIAVLYLFTSIPKLIQPSRIDSFKKEYDHFQISHLQSIEIISSK